MPKLSIEEVMGLQNEGGLDLQQIEYIQKIVLHWKRLEKKEKEVKPTAKIIVY